MTAIETIEPQKVPNPEMNNFFQNLGQEKTVLLLSSFTKEKMKTIKEYIEQGDSESALKILEDRKAELDGYMSEK